MPNPLQEKLKILKNFYKKSKRLPSYSELLKLWQLASKNAVYKIMQKLIEQDFLQKDKQGKLVPTVNFFSLNLYGEVPAGFPVPTPDESAELLSLEDYLIDRPSSTFLLKVNGNSLKDIGIMSGDIVLIEKQSEAKSGQIVLAHIDGEWTLKIFDQQGKKIILLPANKAYKPIIPQSELLIYGIVKGVVRKY